MLAVFQFVAISLAVCASESKFDCQWKTENATYNLCHLQSSSFYEVYDNRESAFYNFTYVFNVANDIESRPPDEICWNNTLRDSYLLPTGYCEESNINETDGDCLYITDITANTAAYQIHRSFNNEAIIHDCYRLHDGETAPTWSYIDAQDPSQGVKLTYTNGDWCDAAEKNREFSLEFYCSERVENIPDKIEEIISEDITCSYVLEIDSAYGCPSECPIHDNKLCGGKGVCEFDYFNSKPQCYCYYGYCGADCSLTGSQCAESDNLLFNVSLPNDDDDSCVFSLKDSFGINSFYDLSFFDLKNENFVVDDMLDREYIYKFNVCGHMDNFENSVPPQCTNYNHGPCTHWDESTWTVGNETRSSRTCDNDYDTFDSGMIANAVQIYYPKKKMYTNETGEPMCFWLGTDLPEGFDMQSYNVTLIDEDDSGRGVVYKMLNGQYCKEDERNRELNLKLTCPDTRVDAFDPYDEAKKIINESVLESGTCVYEIGLESPLACPMTCISVKTNGIEKSYFDSSSSSDSSKVPDGTLFSVCSNHGVCVSDPEARRVRCLCDHGWTGIVCERLTNQTSSSSDSSSSEMSTTAQTLDSKGSNGKGLGIGLGIGIAVLLLVVVGAFWFLQRKKKSAVNAYGNLQHGDGLMLDDALEAGR